MADNGEAGSSTQFNAKHFSAREQRETAERLQIALAAAGLGTWEMDLVTGNRTWSAETMRMHGLDPESQPGDHVDLTATLMHPDDRERLRDLHQQLRDGRNDYAFEYRTTLPDGQQRWISARGKVLDRTSQGPTRIVGVCADVTLQKQLQLVHEYNEAQFRLLADTLPQLVWIANPDGEITYYNARRATYFRDDQPGVSGPEWQPLIHPHDLPATERAWQAALNSGASYEMEHRLRMADGSFRWHLSRAIPVQANRGGVAAWFGSATDIDRLKSSEAIVQAGVDRLQIATEAAAMFAWDMDFESGILSWAENAADILGCKPEDLRPELGQAQAFVHPDDSARLREDFTTALNSGKDRFELEFRGRPRVGKPTYWRTSGKFIRRGEALPHRAVGVTQDVTSHVEAAAQMRLLDERLSAAEEGAGALIYDWDVLSNRVWRSNSLSRIVGWRLDEISNRQEGWLDLLHPEDRVRFEKQREQEEASGDDHYVYEYRVRHRDGAYHWMLDTGRIFRDASGRIMRRAGTTVDITARKQADMAQQRMASLIDLSFEPILVWHEKRGILEWNKGAELLYGYSRQEALGQQPHDLLRTHYPFPHEKFLEILRQTRNWTGEIINTARDGSLVLVESRFQQITFDSEAVILETNRDIRERMRADANLARMAAVAAASHDALYGASLNGRIEAWNPGAEKLFGYSAEEAMGQHISMLALPNQHAEQLLHLRLVASGETIKPFDTQRRTKDGRVIEVSMAMSPVKAADGTVIAISVALHDIGERKQWDKQQRLMNRELAHRVKNSFAILQAILRSTLRYAATPEEFANAFTGRLHSMAAAHDVLTANDWRGAELGALLHHQLSQYVSGQRINLSGGPVNLEAEQAAPLSLVINELATNALKYGALSNSQGVIDVSWETDSPLPGSVILVLHWTERDGPPVRKQRRRGFGSTLIENSLPRANVVMDFKEAGLECTIRWAIASPLQAAQLPASGSETAKA